MRRVRYSVVMSLDGYIAGPKGEAGVPHPSRFLRVGARYVLTPSTDVTCAIGGR
jgi:hypothetical protein